MPRKCGSQEPTFQVVGKYAYSDGAYAAKMFKGYGLNLYRCQEYELKLYLARKKDGAFAFETVCISKPRQNGKSFAARLYAVWMAAIEGKHVLYSAHHGKTVTKMFDAIKALVTNTPDLAALLLPNGRGIRIAPYQGVYFVDDYGNQGGMIEFQTRTNGGARGDTYQVVIIDEAQELTDEQLEGIEPTTLATGEVGTAESETQEIYIGTPPYEKCPGTVFQRLHDAAHGGKDTSLAWLEWAVSEPVEAETTFEDVAPMLYATNPALGRRIALKKLKTAFEKMTRTGFSRECLGWWEPRIALVRPVIDQGKWAACAIVKPPAPSPGCFGVKFSVDGSYVCLAGARRNGDRVHVELIEMRDATEGIQWLADWLHARARDTLSVTIDGLNGSQALITRLHEMRYPQKKMKVPKAVEVSTAASTFAQAVLDLQVTHVMNEGQRALDDSVATSVRRDIGKNGGWGFGGDMPGPVEACSLAYVGAMKVGKRGVAQAR